jgi:K+-sensing histidine kinase KdpD
MEMIIDHFETDLNDKLNTDQKNYLHQLRIKTQGANLLLMNLLDLYKEKKLYLSQKKIHPFIYIKDEINRSISHLFTNKSKNNVTIVNNCPEDLVHQIDRQSFQCVIRNIVDNALKHSQCDTITFNAEITFKGLVITIKDNGIGLPDDIAENFNQNKSIFDYSNNKTRIGLGTVFILEFVNALKSDLKVDSDQNGTKFVLTIPLR